MRLLLYYIPHTFVNCLKKIFRTWVAVFLAVCIGFGVLCGLAASFAADVFDNSSDIPAAEEIFPGSEAPEFPEETVMTVFEMAIGGLVLLVLFVGIYNGDKSGTSIFTMPDVNFLFTAPVKPQSVLMFRLLLQAGLTVVGSLYLAMQIPNLVLNLHIPLLPALLTLVAWFLTLICGKLVSVWVYTFSATRPKVKKLIKPLAVGIALILAAAYSGVVLFGGREPYAAAKLLFASEAGRMIPVWGWIRGVVMYAVEGDFVAAWLCFFGVVAVCAVFAFFIWRMNADFYEDALENVSERQSVLEAAAEGRAPAKKRSGKTKKTGIGKGLGASVFFTKTMYNRFRFSGFGIFNSTSVSYLFVCAAAAVLFRYVFQMSSAATVVYALLAFMIFIRNYGNPLAAETDLCYLWTVPESSYRKLGFCLLAGTTETLLDLLPGYLCSALILGEFSAELAVWPFAFLFLDLFASSSGLLIELLLPVSVHRSIRTAFQLFLKMFMIFPVIFAAISVGILFGLLPALAAVCTVCLLGTAVLFALCPALFSAGRK